MTREQLEKELIPLRWYEIDYHPEILLTAGARSLNFWYNILEFDGTYTVIAENEDGTINENIRNGIETVKEAKAVAWGDYVDQVLQLFE